MSNALIADTQDDTKIEFQADGLGTMRSTGEILCLFLSLENNPEEILADVIREMKLSIEDVNGLYDDKICDFCGGSMYDHKREGWFCTEDQSR